jgi:hypothetical protein
MLAHKKQARDFGGLEQRRKHLLEADSKGTFFNARIRNRFPFQCLGTSSANAD